MKGYVAFIQFLGGVPLEKEAVTAFIGTDLNKVERDI